MSALASGIDVDSINAFVRKVVPQAGNFLCEEVSAGFALVRWRFDEVGARPGGLCIIAKGGLWQAGKRRLTGRVDLYMADRPEVIRARQW